LPHTARHLQSARRTISGSAGPAKTVSMDVNGGPHRAWRVAKRDNCMNVEAGVAEARLEARNPPESQLPETSLSPITPARMSTRQSTLIGAAESPSIATPRIAVPAAPIPVQTA
jgi:hypothetical protein